MPSFCRPFPSVPNLDSKRPLTGQINPPRLAGGGCTARDVAGPRRAIGSFAGNTVRGKALADDAGDGGRPLTCRGLDRGAPVLAPAGVGATEGVTDTIRVVLPGKAIS